MVENNMKIFQKIAQFCNENYEVVMTLILGTVFIVSLGAILIGRLS